jgi:hypothetical protein
MASQADRAGKSGDRQEPIYQQSLRKASRQEDRARSRGTRCRYSGDSREDSSSSAAAPRRGQSGASTDNEPHAKSDVGFEQR